MPNEFKLGEHEARIRTIETDVAEIKADVKELLKGQDERRGAWKLATVAGAVAGFFASLLSSGTR